MQKILEAIAAIRAEVEPVGSPDENKFHHYSYAGEAAIARAVRPLLNKHGLVIFQSVVGDIPPTIDAHGITTILFAFTIAHVSGECWDSAIKVVGQGNDRDSKGAWGDKGCAKANTQAYKYFLNRLFMLDTGDDSDADIPATEKAARKRQTQARGKPAHAATSEELEGLSQACLDKADSIIANVDGAGGAWERKDLAIEIRNAALATCGIKSGTEIQDGQLAAIQGAIRAVEVDPSTFELIP